jgi:preprotein translocase subunit SecE
MAEEKKTPAKVEESKLTKVLNWFKTLPGRIAKPFKNMVAELKKVTWPSKKKWISSSIMVLVFMLFMGVVIGLLDLGATALVNTMSPDPVVQGNTTEAAEVTEGAEEQNAEAEATEAADATPAE